MAYSEIRVILAQMIFNFDLRLTDDSGDWLDQRAFTVWEKGPLNVLITPVRHR